MAKKTITVDYPFESVKPDVLAICCSDGRYIRAIEHFLFARKIDCHDLICFPGGPARFCHETASIFEVSFSNEALDFLVRSHETQTMVLIAHENCSYYVSRFGSCEPERQADDMRRARWRILERHPKIEIQLFLARPKTGKKNDGFAIEEVLI